MPLFIEMKDHTHARVPNLSNKEDVFTLSRARQSHTFSLYACAVRRSLISCASHLFCSGCISWPRQFCYCCSFVLVPFRIQININVKMSVLICLLIFCFVCYDSNAFSFVPPNRAKVNAEQREHVNEPRVFYKQLSNMIEETAWLPIEINVPDTIGIAVEGLSGMWSMFMDFYNSWDRPGISTPRKKNSTKVRRKMELRKHKLVKKLGTSY